MIKNLFRIAAALVAVSIGSSALAQSGPSVPAVTTNGSATITTGSTFQTILNKLAAGGKRRSLTIQNNNITTDNCWITFGTGITVGNAAKGSSILLASGQAFTRYFPYVPLDEIEGTCASNGDTLYVDTQ